MRFRLEPQIEKTSFENRS